MKPITTTIILLLSLLLPPFAASAATTNTKTQTDPSYISFQISSKGLDFLKDLLISKAITTLTPLHIPQIQQYLKIPFLGNVYVDFSNTTLHHINVSTSYLTPGDSGLFVLVSGATANVSLDWYYSYYTGWFLPIQVSDRGLAYIQVEGLQVGLTLGLENQGGKLKLSLMECGCFVHDITIKLQGGASWLYQGFVDVFAGQIQSAVEDTITQKLKEATVKLDSFLQSLPEGIPIDDVASLNATFVNDPTLSNSSIGFEINGLFAARCQVSIPKFYKMQLQTLSCDDQSKMIGIFVDEAVFHSASTLYYEANYLQWTVDKIPDQAILNTAHWRFIIPQLYKRYPNDDMNLNVSFARPPELRISPEKVRVTANVELIINVLEYGEVVPVVCILLEIQASGSMNIRGNSLGGKVKLEDFQMTQEWSKVGNLKMFLIKPLIWTVVETVLLPYTNVRLWRGFDLPMIHGFTLENAKIRYSDSSLEICSDVAYSDSDDHAQALIHLP